MAAPPSRPKLGYFCSETFGIGDPRFRKRPEMGCICFGAFSDGPMKTRTSRSSAIDFCFYLCISRHRSRRVFPARPEVDLPLFPRSVTVRCKELDNGMNFGLGPISKKDQLSIVKNAQHGQRSSFSFH